MSVLCRTSATRFAAGPFRRSLRLTGFTPVIVSHPVARWCGPVHRRHSFLSLVADSSAHMSTATAPTAAAAVTASAAPAAAAASTYSVAYVTVPSDAVARQLSQAILSHALAACVNIIPGVTSLYVWEGKLQTDSELILMIKTETALVPDLVTFVRKHHPYKVPEVIAVPITAGSPPYLSWLSDAIKTASADAAKAAAATTAAPNK